MTSTHSKGHIDKILKVIREKGGLATKTDIKRSSNEFNKDAEGLATLERILAEMVSEGLLVIHLHEADNNKLVTFYRLNNGNNAGCGESSRNNPADISIGGTFNFTIEKGRELLMEAVSLFDTGKLAKSWFALIRPANSKSKGKRRKPRPVAVTKESAPVYDETPFEVEPYTPPAYNNNNFHF